ncbi:unnamed protein product [Oikopleura dioica]|uniref:Peptidase S1 domain-containing protein n=1 Tax=Oikopleura dioica TaxID=34765 RepID=E4XQ34_OIKDI|nr:unnamed protein product [Oikopleura dioica]
MKTCVENYTKYIQPVCLPESLNEFSDDICGVVSGWGKSDPNQSPLEAPKILQISSIAHISEKQCKEEFDKKGTRIDHKFQSGILFCAGTPSTSKITRDTCSGDSGGPFVSYGYREEDEFTEINEDYVRNDRAVLLGITSSGAEILIRGQKFPSKRPIFFYSFVPKFENHGRASRSGEQIAHEAILTLAGEVVN